VRRNVLAPKSGVEFNATGRGDGVADRARGLGRGDESRRLSGKRTQRRLEFALVA
jgi:hypothetical protein